MERIDWEKFDSINDPDERWGFWEDVERKIAEAIGWATGKPNDVCWYDQRGRFTGYYTNERPARMQIDHPQFSPWLDLDPALVAAGCMTDLKGWPFTLRRDRAGNWQATFLTHRNEHVGAVNEQPARAICDAILKASRIMTPEELFAKR